MTAKSTNTLQPTQAFDPVVPIAELQLFNMQMQDWWKQMALDKALKERYTLIIAEIERRKGFY